jgi:hypothetical protein
MNNIDFNAGTMAVPEKLNKSKYLVLSGFSDEEKVQAVKLCIHDVLVNSVNNPNIVIVCPDYLIKSWYSTLLWGMGVEFKCLGVFEKSLNLFSKSTANLCLVSAEKANTAFKSAGDLVWDLMIIDGTAPTAEINTAAEKILINAPLNDENGGNYEKYLPLIKSVINRKKKDDLSFNTEHIIQSTAETAKYNLKTISYKVPAKLISKAERVVDIDSDIPLYKYGGNIFEEYNIKERKIYLNKVYDSEQLGVLIEKDVKLSVFLKMLNEVLNTAENTVVIYCTAANTKSYVNKVLNEYYKEKNVGICDGKVFGNAFSDTDEPRIIVTDDMVGNKLICVNKVTHIINYEYPENPAVLEQRYKRGGRSQGKNEPVFCIFCDEDNKFDGRMLRKTVLSNLSLAFNNHAAMSSLIWGIENIEEHLIVLILDLKFMSDFAADDAVESFRIEYCASDAVDKKSAESIAKSRLEKLVDMFGQHHVLEVKEVDGERLFMELTEKISSFRGKKLFTNQKAKGILTIDEKANTDFKLAEKPEKVKTAADFVKKITETGDAFNYELIREETEKLSDILKLSALINLWKYYRYEKKIARPYKTFVELYNSQNAHNEGVKESG